MAKDNKQHMTKSDCFIIMPISDTEGYDKGHFNKVYEDILKVACNKAGFNPVRADEVKQTNLIHLDILQKLIDSPMAICDLSSRNPNVLFELGLRQAFDKPTVLVQECGTPKIFDISPLRYTEYRKELQYREVLEDQELISQAIVATKDATDKGDGINSIVSLLSLASPATLKDITVNDTARMMQIIMSEMNDLRTDFRRTIRRNEDRGLFENSGPDNLRRIEMDLDIARIDLSQFRELVALDAPVEILKERYDRVQEKLMRLLEGGPVRVRSNAKMMIDEADSLIAHRMRNDNK